MTFHGGPKRSLYQKTEKNIEIQQGLGEAARLPCLSFKRYTVKNVPCKVLALHDAYNVNYLIIDEVGHLPHTLTRRPPPPLHLLRCFLRL